METSNRLFGLGKSFPEKHKSRWLWLNAIDCSAESCVLAGLLFFCMGTQHLVGFCPGVFALSDPKWFCTVTHGRADHSEELSTLAFLTS